MSYRKIYLLDDEEEREKDVTKQLTIHQNFEAEEGSVVWDCALLLLSFFEKCFTEHRFPFDHRSQEGGHTNSWRVLELGSGTGVVGLAFSRFMTMIVQRGSLVLSDRASQIPLINKNIQANQLSSNRGGDSIIDLSTIALDWSREDQVQLFFESYIDAFDFILVSDCIYGNGSSEPLAVFLEQLLIHSPCATIYLSFEKRPPHATVTRDFGKEFFDYLDQSLHIDAQPLSLREMGYMQDPNMSIHMLTRKQ